MEFIKEQLLKLVDLLWAYAPQLAFSIFILVFGWWLASRISKIVEIVLKKRDLDPSLTPFLVSIVGIGLKAIVIITSIDVAGIEATSFVAILGAAGLAIGLALQGTLQNFAGGVMILLFKPLRVGHVVETSGHTGVVDQIQIFNTILKTWDNKVIIIPNAQVSNNSLVNYSMEETRKVEWVFGIGYNADYNLAKSLIKEHIFTDSRVIKEEKDFIKLANWGDSSIDIKVRAVVKGTDYWDVFFEKNEELKLAFDKAGIEIPFPNRTVHIVNSESKK